MCRAANYYALGVVYYDIWLWLRLKLRSRKNTPRKNPTFYRFVTAWRTGESDKTSVVYTGNGAAEIHGPPEISRDSKCGHIGSYESVVFGKNQAYFHKIKPELMYKTTFLNARLLKTSFSWNLVANIAKSRLQWRVQVILLCWQMFHF